MVDLTEKANRKLRHYMAAQNITDKRAGVISILEKMELEIDNE